MWEKPRPERLRRLDEDRKQQFRQSVIAYSIVFAAVAFLVKASMDNRDASRRSGKPQTPVPQHHPSPVSPESELTRPQTGGPVAPDPSARRRAPQRSLTNTARGDPEVMRSLIETCTYWTQQNTRGQYAGNQEMACRSMAAYAHEHGFSVPQVSVRMPASSAGSTTGTSGAGPQVYVDECTRHTYGSVAYRQCRASEKRRLSDECQNLRNRLETAHGPGRAKLLARTTATCSMANSYQIVR
jgi:hypothetical protein